MDRVFAPTVRLNPKGKKAKKEDLAPVKCEICGRRFGKHSEQEFDACIDQIIDNRVRSDTMQPGGQQPVAKLVLIKTAPNNTYINPNHVVCVETVGTGSRITMIDGRDFTTPEDMDSVAMHISE